MRFLAPVLAWGLVVGWSGNVRAAGGKASIVITWTKVPGAAAYVIQIASDKRMRKVVTKQKVTTNRFKWSRLASKKFYWRVAAVDGNGRVGHYSGVNLIKPVVVKAKPTYPKKGAKFGIGLKGPLVTLRWKGAGGIKKYTVTITHKETSKTVQLKTRKTKISYTAPRRGKYVWKVSGVDYNGKEIPPGPTSSFTVFVKPPGPVSPANRQAFALQGGTTTVKLRWGKRPVKTYVVQVADDQRFKQNAFRRKLKAKRTLDVKRTAYGPFFWRVKGLDPDTGWSAPRRVNIVPDAPEVLEPADNAELVATSGARSVTLRWKSVGDVKGYDVVVLEPDDKVVKAKPDAKLGTEATSWTSPELPLGSYRIGVRTRGEFTSTWRLRTVSIVDEPVSAKVKLPAPSVAARSTGSAEVSRERGLRITWEPVAGADRYEVQESATKDFANVRSTVKADGPEARLKPDGEGTLYWRVRAISKDGVAGAWSAPNATTVTFAKEWAWSGDEASQVQLGFGGGLVFNLGAVLTGGPVLDLTFWLPAIDYRMGLSLRGRWFMATDTLSDADNKIAIDATMHAIPLDLMLMFRVPFEAGAFNVGIGGHASILMTTLVGPGDVERAATDVTFGGTLGMGVFFHAGPGGFFLDASYSLVVESEGLVRGNAGGLNVMFGYRVTLL